MERLFFSTITFCLIGGFCLVGQMKSDATAGDFSTVAAAQSFAETGDMSKAVDYSQLAVAVVSDADLPRVPRSTGCSTGCSVGCSRGCSVGCSTGCSVGCKP